MLQIEGLTFDLWYFILLSIHFDHGTMMMNQKN